MHPITHLCRKFFLDPQFTHTHTHTHTQPFNKVFVAGLVWGGVGIGAGLIVYSWKFQNKKQGFTVRNVGHMAFALTYAMVPARSGLHRATFVLTYDRTSRNPAQQK